jgi:glyceraldehyde-3-phosphate dehydrogenase/erythrose-4-phosphate dehydrogenase
MESKGANQWLINVDANKVLTLKSNQIQVTQLKKPTNMHKPINEDDIQLDSSSICCSPAKKKAHSKGESMLESGVEIDYDDNSSSSLPSNDINLSHNQLSSRTASTTTDKFTVLLKLLQPPLLLLLQVLPMLLLVGNF